MLFSAKAREKIIDDMKKGSVAKSKKVREPRDFTADYNGHRHIHIDKEGKWDGIPATAIKAAMVRAAGTAGYVMTKSKTGFFVVPDGFDIVDRSPLIKITKGEPSPIMHYTRIQGDTIDMVNRPIWEEGWEANVTIEHDADVLSKEDIASLLNRAGRLVGILAGRPASTNSVGQGWGTFIIKGEEDTNFS